MLAAQWGAIRAKRLAGVVQDSRTDLYWGSRHDDEVDNLGLDVLSYISNHQPSAFIPHRFADERGATAVVVSSNMQSGNNFRSGQCDGI